jgi:hypothetical protein
VDELDPETATRQKGQFQDFMIFGISKEKQQTNFSQQGSHKGRLSPTPVTHAPRIPTLKLPQTTLATMRKAGGLGSEASQGNHTWKGKGKESTRVKWCSIV